MPKMAKIFSSVSDAKPESLKIPSHIAMIMDGNGRWAKKRFMPRVMGHKRGLSVVREMVKSCDDLGVKYLTLFAFSSENWRRPQDEVSFLMQLFLTALQKEIQRMYDKNVRLKIIGDISAFDLPLRDTIQMGMDKTANNTGLTLTIAANYGGRWDIRQAVQSLFRARPECIEQGFSDEDLSAFLATNYAPEPDLFIRTGGEERISNFLMWQLAYTELYFTDVLWPDFGKAELEKAISSYSYRERRFGRISEQLDKK